MGLTGYTAEEIIGHLRKGLCTNQDLYDIVTEFRRKNPREDPLDVDDRAVGSWRSGAASLLSIRLSPGFGLAFVIRRLSVRAFVVHFRKGTLAGEHNDGRPAPIL